MVLDIEIYWLLMANIRLGPSDPPYQNHGLTATMNPKTKLLKNYK